MNRRSYCLAALGLALISTQIVRAGTEMVTDNKQVVAAPSGPYDYHVHADVRDDKGIGLSLGVYGGAVGFQDGDLKIDNLGATFPGDTQSRAGATAGIRVTNVWPDFDSITGGPRPGAVGLILPAMALDIFWTGYNYKANGTGSFTGNSFTADINSVSVEYVPELKFNLGWIRPYFGVGVGFTYVHASNATVTSGGSNVGLNGSSDDFDFSPEGLAGVEFFLDPRWSLSLEYKYLYILDPSFHGSVTTPGGTSDVHYHLDGLGNHYVTAGVNYYF